MSKKHQPASTQTMPALTAEHTRIADGLTYRYDDVFSRETVQQAVDRGRATPAPVARFPNFLPILTERFARDQLLAAALAMHLSAGKVHVRSAGSAPTQQIHPLTIQALAERGIELTESFPKPLTDGAVHPADVIVTMGCGEVCPIFPGKRYEDWEFADPVDQPIEAVRAIRDDIQARVTTLLGEILHQS